MTNPKGHILGRSITQRKATSHNSSRNFFSIIHSAILGDPCYICTTANARDFKFCTRVDHV